MKNDMEYAVGKLTAAMYVLTTHPDGIKERLLEAYDLHLSAIHESDIPLELKERWNELLKRMGKMGAAVGPRGEVWRDSIQNTIPRIRKKTATQLADDIDAFHSSLKDYINKMNSEPVATTGQRC